MLFISEELDGPWQATPGQHAHQALLAQRTHQTREGHRGEMVEHRAQLQTEAAVCRQQDIAGHFWSHRAVPQDEVRQYSEHRSACGALKTPDGEPAQPDPDVMRVTGQTPTSATGRLVFQLQAEGEEEGEETLEKRLTVSQQAAIGGFVVKIDGDSPVFASLAGCGSHSHPQVRWSMQLVTKGEGNASPFQEDQ